MEKQIVFIPCEEWRSLSLKNENLVVKEDGVIKNKLSCSKILSIIIIGSCTFTTNLFQKLLKYNVTIMFVAKNFKPIGHFGNGLDGNYLLREKQYATNLCLQTAKHLVLNKITNQTLLLEQLRNRDDVINTDIKKLKGLRAVVLGTDSAESLRGVEGNASKIFFGHYFKEFGRYRRMPRTRADVINFLLDVGYTYLFNLTDTLLQLYGFDTYKGVYHTLFFQRKSLVCDVMEPFRCIIDKQIRKSRNLGQIKEKDFRCVQGEYQLDRDKQLVYTKIMMEAIFEHKEKIFLYVRQYYRAVMAETTATLPVFYIDE